VREIKGLEAKKYPHHFTQANHRPMLPSKKFGKVLTGRLEAEAESDQDGGVASAINLAFKASLMRGVSEWF
jgi:hypothetical protein